MDYFWGPLEKEEKKRAIDARYWKVLELWLEGKALKEIGAIMGVSASRAEQMKGKAQRMEAKKLGVEDHWKLRYDNDRSPLAEIIAGG